MIGRGELPVNAVGVWELWWLFNSIK